MFDFVFDWRKDLDVGIAVMDEQHQRFFKIGRDIEQLVRFNCIGVTDKQLLDIVCELRDFVVYHFYEEETIMDIAGYENSEMHKREHLEFINRVYIQCKISDIQISQPIRQSEKEL